MVKPKSIVLFSGGIDSLACLLWARTEFDEHTTALYVDLDTKYATEELHTVNMITNYFSIRSIQLGLYFLGSFEGDIGHIPMRNIFLLETAALYSDNIVFGMLKNELSEDKGPSFIRMMQRLFDSQTVKNIYHEQTKIKIHTPFSGMTKTQVVKWLLLKGVSEKILVETIGCLNGRACGQCISCFNRWVAFENNGLYNIDTYIDSNPIEWGVKQIGRKTNKLPTYAFWKKASWFKEVYNAYDNAYKRGASKYKPNDLLKAYISNIL